MTTCKDQRHWITSEDKAKEFFKRIKKDSPLPDYTPRKNTKKRRCQFYTPEEEEQKMDEAAANPDKAEETEEEEEEEIEEDENDPEIEEDGTANKDLLS